MIRLILGLLFMISISIGSWGQQGVDEINILLVEANGQYASARYDDAIRTYNRALALDNTHPDALFMRGQTKYQLGAYQGTKMDLIKLIEAHGVNKRTIKLMALTELKLKNSGAAANTIEVILEMDPYDAAMHYLAAGIALEKGDRNEACESFARASVLGYGRATNDLNRLCGGLSDWLDIAPSDTTADQPSSSTSSTTSSTNSNTSNAETSSNDSSDTGSGDADTGGDPASIRIDPVDNVEDAPSQLDEILNKSEGQMPSPNNNDGQGSDPQPKEDVSQEIVIDDKLSLILTNGIGERKVETTPNIFLLSDEDGIVVIDICIARTGEVTETQFNREASTIFRSSMISLALRKAKELVFMPSLREDQCGTIIYQLRS